MVDHIYNVPLSRLNLHNMDTLEHTKMSCVLSYLSKVSFIIEALNKCLDYAAHLGVSVIILLIKFIIYLSLHTHRVYWTLNYTADKIWKFNSRQPPYIIDPANPSNNLYRSGITKLLTYAPSGYGGDWSKFRSEIHSLDLRQRYYET